MSDTIDRINELYEIVAAELIDLVQIAALDELRDIALTLARKRRDL